MYKTKISLTIFTLLIITGSLFAAPAVHSDCCQPKPVGGMQILEDNTLYPLWAEKERIGSAVVLSFHVDNQGAISNVEVSQSGGAMFDESAISAVMNTAWAPAMHENRAIAVTFELPFEYRAK